MSASMPGNVSLMGPLTAPSHEVVAGSITGWRAWDAKLDGDAAQLLSPEKRTPWPVTGIEAQHRHRQKSADCACGINAYATPELLNDSGYMLHCQVSGSVELWGEVRAYERGYRGQHARPLELWVRRRESMTARNWNAPGWEDASVLATRLRETYGVPVHILSDDAEQALWDNYNKAVRERTKALAEGYEAARNSAEARPFLVFMGLCVLAIAAWVATRLAIIPTLEQMASQGLVGVPHPAGPIMLAAKIMAWVAGGLAFATGIYGMCMAKIGGWSYFGLRLVGIMACSVPLMATVIYTGGESGAQYAHPQMALLSAAMQDGDVEVSQKDVSPRSWSLTFAFLGNSDTGPSCRTWRAGTFKWQSDPFTEHTADHDVRACHEGKRVWAERLKPKAKPTRSTVVVKIPSPSSSAPFSPWTDPQPSS